MSDIRKSKQLIESSLTGEQHGEYTQSRLPSPAVLDYEGGLELVELYTKHYDELDEGLKDTMGNLFKGMSNGAVDLTKTTGAVAKSKLRNLFTKKGINGRQFRKEREQFKLLTKQLLNSYYGDYVATLEVHKKRKTQYSDAFFKDLLDSLGLEPKVERAVGKQLEKDVHNFLVKMKKAYEEYKRKNPNTPEPVNRNGYFGALPKLYRGKFTDDIDKLIGEILGTASIAAVGDYMANKGDDLGESTDDSNDVEHEFLERLNTNVVLEGVERLYSQKQVNELYEGYVKYSQQRILDELDDGTRPTEEELEDDIEDIHENIYDMYVRPFRGY